MSTQVVSKETLAEEYKGSSTLEARISLHERFSINSYGWHRWIFDLFALPRDAHSFGVAVPSHLKEARTHL